MSNKILTIQNEKLTVQINQAGAELWSIKTSDNCEYLWQGDAAYWSDRAINLFPYIARMTDKSYTYGGQVYHMDIHGFAKDSMFEVAEHTADCLSLKISATEETLVQYPFAFDFYITYQLADDTLNVSFRVVNKDTKTMYFAVGGHPGFNVPLEAGLTFEDYYVEFSTPCDAKRVIFSEDCFVVDGAFDPFTLPENNRYQLAHNMFDDDAIILAAMPRQIQLGSDKGTKKVIVTYPEMDYLGLWHMPHTDAPYICIEPWTSLPSRKGVVEALETQENLLNIAAGAEYTNTWSIQII